LYTYLKSLGANLRREERGATMVEYGLIVAAIALVVVAAAFLLGGAISDLFGRAANEVGNTP
jgi:pilus assembly protein Flp/PilA